MLPKRGLRLVFPESLVQPFCSAVQVMFLAAPAMPGRGAIHYGGLVQVSAPLAQSLSHKSHLYTTNSWVDEVLCVGAWWPPGRKVDLPVVWQQECCRASVGAG